MAIHKGDDPEVIIAHGRRMKCGAKLDCMEAHNGLTLAEHLWAYFGIMIEEEEGEGIYMSTRGQFGVETVSKYYIKAMKMSIGWLRKHGVFFYADDVVIFAETFEKCLWLLGEVLRCLEKDGFVVSAKKCEFFKTELEVLGQIVGNE